MSSYLREGFRPVYQPVYKTVYDVSLKDSEAVLLEKILGRGGREKFLVTLDSPEAVQRGWRCAEREEAGSKTYERVLTPDQIDQVLVQNGVSEVRLKLKIGTHVAKLTRETSYTAERQNSPEVRTLLHKTSNRAVNELLAQTAMRHVTEQVMQSVNVQLRNRIQVQVNQQISARQQNQVCYQTRAFVCPTR